jgi:hypothetical protein
MFRVTTYYVGGTEVFAVEGKLAEPWLQELDQSWRNRTGGVADSPARFDLSGLTHVDSAGKKFLAARYAEGHELIASGCLIKSILAEITDAPTALRRCQAEHSLNRD